MPTTTINPTVVQQRPCVVMPMLLPMNGRRRRMMTHQRTAPRRLLKLSHRWLYFVLIAISTTAVSGDKRKKKSTRTVPIGEGPYNFKTPNLLFIFTDQHRYDTVRFIQDGIKGYDNKFKIRTPNIDRLAANGVHFKNAYCHSPQCVPSRATMRTGCTIERTGLQDGGLKKRYVFWDQFKKKVEDLVTYDKLLVKRRGGYTAENYGRFDLPEWFYYDKPSNTTPDRIQVVQYNDYLKNMSAPTLILGKRFQDRFIDHLDERANANVISRSFGYRQQANPQSGFPYDPIPLDSRFGKKTDFDILDLPFGFEQGSSNAFGRDSLKENHTSTGITGDMACRALKRLVAGDKPFSLTVSFWNPHPPCVATGEYFDYYYQRRSRLYVSPSHADQMKDSAYRDASQRLKLIKRHDYDNPSRIQGWTAAYYAMIEEVDDWVGRLLDIISEAGLRDNTFVIFTADHGEMLGAHGMRNKGVLLEESIRVPLVMSFPGQIGRGNVVENPVGHIDLFATIADYLNVPSTLHRSDGQSLRRFIERTSYNNRHDETTVVSEQDLRLPVSETKLSYKLAGAPNFMLRHGRYKIILPKLESSDVLDMMYDLQTDPFEMNNLLAGKDLPLSVIGKAEHLKILLLEWMRRMDGGAARYYSDPKYNFGEGRGDMVEIAHRRTWKTVDYWQSHDELCFGDPVLSPDSNEFVRHEWLYIGRTTNGQFRAKSFKIEGRDKDFFEIIRAPLKPKLFVDGKVFRFKVSFSHPKPVAIRSLDAEIHIETNVKSTKIPICGNSWIVFQ